ncbi:MAG TPA: biopolymer transporter ExbD [Chthoniobacteraceae bacterium]|jgi:biopolymer transport protein ExbD|nr:biopolymer transporter ExbD [Chthoniobacter sp.]HEV7866379.1 biopolymer transporter ExbD [Chthoniobacteraceae bacterium]
MAGSVGSEDGDIGFQIAPMVDVVFVLMLFFMACAGAQVKEKELNIALPSGSTNKENSAVTPIMIDISGEGQVTMNNTAFGTPADRSLTTLREWLKSNIEQYGGDDPVIIRPQADTRHERIIDVLNAAAFAGVRNLTFS